MTTQRCSSANSAFAENLRSENYENGDAIEWQNPSSGAVAVYNASASNLETYGRLYNCSRWTMPVASAQAVGMSLPMQSGQF